MVTRKIGVLLLIGVVLNWLPKLHAQEWADFYHNGDSIYEAEAYGRIVEDGYLNAFPYPHKSQYETQYFHPDPNVIRHTYSRVRYNASPEEMERYGRLYEEYQQLVTKDNSTNKRVIYVRTEDAGGGTLIFRSFEGNLELKQCKEPYRNDEEVVGDYRFFRRHTEQKVTSVPSWLNPHLADVQEGQVILDASISLGAQMGADLGAELAMAAIPWRVAGQGLWVLKKYRVKLISQAIKITEKGLKHVMDRHTLNSLVQYSNKSKFFDGEDIVSLILSGTQHPMVKQTNGRFARTIDVGRNIGIDRTTGSPTPIMTIITEIDGSLVTAFPGKP